MPSTLPEHALVTLLRQCYIAPRCQASRARPTRLLHSSTRALHIPSRPRHRNVPVLERPRKDYHTTSRLSEELSFESRARIGSNDVQEANSSPLFADHGHESSAHEQETRIAIIGGGITGLTAAHYITREMPHAKVTIYEAGNRVGGWLQSEYVDVEGGKILLEKGPRTLRPNTEAALVTLDMVGNFLHTEMMELG